MRLFKTIALSLFLFIYCAAPSLVVAKPDKDFKVTLCKETARFYRVENPRRYKFFMPPMKAANNVARMFPMWPARNECDRSLQFFELGHLESFWTPNLVEANIPGITYSNGTVHKFSVDYSMWGLNQESISWSYLVAKAIQSGKPLPKRYGQWTPNHRFIEMMKGVKIPKTLGLKKIDISIAYTAKDEYLILSRKYSDPVDIKRHMVMPPYTEDSQDDIDSELVYRIIEELDRKSRNWNYGLKDYSPHKLSLYRDLTKFVNEYVSE